MTLMAHLADPVVQVRLGKLASISLGRDDVDNGLGLGWKRGLKDICGSDQCRQQTRTDHENSFEEFYDFNKG